MPNVASRTYAIARAPVVPGENWVNAAGEIVIWVSPGGGVIGWIKNYRFSPPTGSITATGQTVGKKLSSPVFKPDTASISFFGLQPGPGSHVVTPGVGSISFNGLTPVANQPNKVFQPPTGSITASGKTPSAVMGTIMKPAQGSITFTGKSVGGWKVSWAQMKIG